LCNNLVDNSLPQIEYKTNEHHRQDNPGADSANHPVMPLRGKLTKRLNATPENDRQRNKPKNLGNLLNPPPSGMLRDHFTFFARFFSLTALGELPSCQVLLSRR
jgi:hypothetical protein